jgi:putative ABC transport system substrate-binding protein
LVIIPFILVLCLTGCQKKAAKQDKITIGIVNVAPDLEDTVDVFKKAMIELGYIENRNISYYYEGPLGTYEALDPAISRVLEKKPDLILSLTTPVTLKVKEAAGNSNTPVVFCIIGDPIGPGIVQSLRKPGGSLTGIQARGVGIKALEWLLQIVPELKRLYLFYNPDYRAMTATMQNVKKTASHYNIELITTTVRSQEDILEALAHIPVNVQALFQVPSAYWAPYLKEFVQAALDHKKPLMSHEYEWAEAGALASFGVDGVSMGRQAARLAHKILQGTMPALLPVEQVEFFLTLNLKTAEALGLTIPDSILKQADHIIRQKPESRL